MIKNLKNKIQENSRPPGENLAACFFCKKPFFTSSCENFAPKTAQSLPKILAKMKRILVFEDNPNYRKNLAELLRTEPDFTVVGEFSDCRQIKNQVEFARPDLVLLDIDMPHVDGLQGLFILKQNFPAVRAMMLTIFDDNEKVFNAICLGADGYLLKDTAPEKIIAAIHELFDGGAPMTPAIARKVLQIFPRAGFRASREDYFLTEKEREVLAHLVAGLSYKMVASEMEVSINTVRTHVSGVYSKLKVHSVSEAVAKAIREQIV